MNLPEKVMVYQTVLASLSKGVYLAAVLREQDADEGDITKVEQRNQKLAKAAAKLREGLVKDWIGQAETLRSQIRETNSKLQGQIRQIERQTDIAERIVKALGFLDDIINITKGVLVR